MPQELKPTSSGATPRARLLVVDDHADTLTLMARMLGKAGYDVLTADGVASALAMAASANVDLLITDVELTDGNGAHLCQDLCKQRPDLPAIAVTGHPADVDLLPGFRAHLPKPIDFSTLLATIDRCLASAKK